MGPRREAGKVPRAEFLQQWGSVGFIFLLVNFLPRAASLLMGTKGVDLWSSQAVGGVSAVWPVRYGPWDGGLNKHDQVLPAVSGPRNQGAVGNPGR